ncbi:hypothetical protein D3C72_2600240 [compost metagenome]
MQLEDRRMQAIGVVRGLGDKAEQRGHEVAAQPGVGGWGGLVERLAREPLDEGL